MRAAPRLRTRPLPLALGLTLVAAALGRDEQRLCWGGLQPRHLDRPRPGGETLRGGDVPPGPDAEGPVVVEMRRGALNTTGSDSGRRHAMPAGAVVRLAHAAVRALGSGKDAASDLIRSDAVLPLTTLEDPRLVALFRESRRTWGAMEYGKQGQALPKDDLAWFRTSCPTGPALFVVRDYRDSSHSRRGATGPHARDILYQYARAEAGRLTCGTVNTRALTPH